MRFFSKLKPGEAANKYILVHCTHGHNRTGFMIIHYLMRTQMNSVEQVSIYPHTTGSRYRKWECSLVAIYVYSWTIRTEIRSLHSSIQKLHCPQCTGLTLNKKKTFTMYVAACDFHLVTNVVLGLAGTGCTNVCQSETSRHLQATLHWWSLHFLPWAKASGNCLSINTWVEKTWNSWSQWYCHNWPRWGWWRWFYGCIAGKRYCCLLLSAWLMLFVCTMKVKPSLWVGLATFCGCV